MFYYWTIKGDPMHVIVTASLPCVVHGCNGNCMLLVATLCKMWSLYGLTLCDCMLYVITTRKSKITLVWLVCEGVHYAWCRIESLGEENFWKSMLTGLWFGIHRHQVVSGLSMQAWTAEVYHTLRCVATPTQHTPLCRSLIHVLKHKALKSATPKKQFCGSASNTKKGRVSKKGPFNE